MEAVSRQTIRTVGAAPEVSVVMITYNHQAFIAQAIESVLMQKTGFSYELVIGEDHSLDCTGEIVRSYQHRYPDTIRALLREKNVGMQANFVETLKACRGRYVALLEGDDYWTDPEKLQVQVAFLRAHPACSTCFHDVSDLLEDGTVRPHELEPRHRVPFSGLRELQDYCYLPTCSVMFRRGLFGEFPNWFFSLKMGDWPLHILNAEHGPIGFIDRVMGVHRLHPDGVWTSKRRQARLTAHLEMYRTMASYLGREYRPRYRMLIAATLYELMKVMEHDGDLKGAAAWARELLLTPPHIHKKSSTMLLKMFMRFRFPRAYAALKGRIVRTRQ